MLFRSATAGSPSRTRSVLPAGGCAPCDIGSAASTPQPDRVGHWRSPPWETGGRRRHRNGCSSAPARGWRSSHVGPHTATSAVSTASLRHHQAVTTRSTPRLGVLGRTPPAAPAHQLCSPVNLSAAAPSVLGAQSQYTPEQCTVSAAHPKPQHIHEQRRGFLEHNILRTAGSRPRSHREPRGRPPAQSISVLAEGASGSAGDTALAPLTGAHNPRAATATTPGKTPGSSLSPKKRRGRSPSRTSPSPETDSSARESRARADVANSH